VARCSNAVGEVVMSNSSPELAKKVLMYTTVYCPYCVAARNLLDARSVEYTDLAVDGNPELRAEMSRLSNARTVPQIWINDTHVGGYTELAALERSGKLDLLLG
jgi:glutaredoxin 3